MIIILYVDFNGKLWMLRNPCQATIDKVEYWYPTAIMKVYDFEAAEILTYTNDEGFSWSLMQSVVNPLLTGFKDTSKRNNTLVS